MTIDSPGVEFVRAALGNAARPPRRWADKTPGFWPNFVDALAGWAGDARVELVGVDSGDKASKSESELRAEEAAEVGAGRRISNQSVGMLVAFSRSKSERDRWSMGQQRRFRSERERFRFRVDEGRFLERLNALKISTDEISEAERLIALGLAVGQTGPSFEDEELNRVVAQVGPDGSVETELLINVALRIRALVAEMPTR